MAKESQTDAVVLAALSIEAMTGYVLRQQVQHNLGHFWSESFGQIYPALARLSGQQLIERTHEGGGRADAAPYRLTPAGRERLVELLSTPPTPTTPRNGLLLRLFFGNAIGEEACRRLVLEARAHAESQLTYLAQARREASDGANGDNTRYFLITTSAGEHAARASILWANETLQALGDSDV